MIKLPKLFSNRRFRRVVIAVAIIILVLTVLNLFVIGGDLFIFSFNSSLNTPLAILVSMCAFSVWRLMVTEKQNRRLWTGMLLGWFSWTLAEILWTSFSLFTEEVPYPSLADLFWFIGYIPILIGLVTRIRSIPIKPKRVQSLVIWGFSALVAGFAFFFILTPILQDFDPQRLMESILNLAYPLFDLFVVIIVLRLFFSYEEGDYGFCWRLIALGFLSMTVSDLIFTYSSWQGTYYPDMQANLISRLGVDTPYTLSYLLWFTGIYALILLRKDARSTEINSTVRMVRTYGHILIYTDEDDSVIEVSPNYPKVFGDEQVKGKRLSEVLIIPERDGQVILELLRKEGKLADLPIHIRDRSGNVQDAKLSGLAVQGSRNTYAGSNLLLRMRVVDPSFDDPLNQESRGMTRYILLQSGSHFKDEIGQFFADYYLVYIKALLDMAYHQGGAVMSQSLLDKMLSTSQEHNWNIRFNPQTILEYTAYPVNVLREALPVLLETAKTHVAQITGPLIIEKRLREVGAKFSETVHRDIERFGRSESDAWFSDHRRQGSG